MELCSTLSCNIFCRLLLISAQILSSNVIQYIPEVVLPSLRSFCTSFYPLFKPSFIINVYAKIQKDGVGEDSNIALKCSAFEVFGQLLTTEAAIWLEIFSYVNVYIKGDFIIPSSCTLIELRIQHLIMFKFLLLVTEEHHYQKVILSQFLFQLVSIFRHAIFNYRPIGTQFFPFLKMFSDKNLQKVHS